MKKLFFLIVAFAATITFSNCSKDDENTVPKELLGKWEATTSYSWTGKKWYLMHEFNPGEHILEFFKNGEVIFPDADVFLASNIMTCSYNRKTQEITFMWEIEEETMYGIVKEMETVTCKVELTSTQLIIYSTESLPSKDVYKRIQ